jgi:RND family efflux transporter MFP subunit
LKKKTNRQAMTHSPPHKLIFSVASVAALVLMLVWMQGGFTKKVPPGNVLAAEKTEPVHGATAKAELKQIGETMRWPGTVTARSVAQVSSKVPARILEIHVKTGDLVKAGQIVAKLDQTEWQTRADQARAQLAQTQAQAAKTAAELRRMQNLFDQEAATQQSLEAAQAGARSSEAQVAQAKAAIATAESLSADTVLRAPFDGTVVKRNLEPGDTALPGAAVLTVQSGQKLRVEADIPETCARAIRLGETLNAIIGGNAQTAKIEEIAPAADPQTRTVRVKAGLDGPAQPGAFAWVEQSCGGHSALLIPAAAVSRSGQLESVRLLEQGTAKLRHVRTGKEYQGMVEVLSGLKPGDVVLLGGAK